MRRFRYCADPICLVSALLYAANRLWLAPHWGSAMPLLTRHLNDALLIPCALPLLLWLQRRVGLRGHDQPPTGAEIFGALFVWSVLFEWGFPRVLHRGIGDPLDVLAYAAGAIVAGCWWAGGNTRVRSIAPPVRRSTL